MIGESVIGGVFIPRVLIVLMLAFTVSLLLRRALRSFNAYRFIWHAALFDTAVFVALAWLIAKATLGVISYGIAN